MKMILISFVVVTLIVNAKCQINDRPHIKYVIECAQSSGTPTEDLIKLRQGQLIEEPNVKKFIGCVLRNLDVQDDKGKIIEQTLRSKLSSLNIKKDEIERLIKKCVNKRGANINETAYLLFQCFSEASPEFLKIV